jgi:hypothetical protein
MTSPYFCYRELLPSTSIICAAFFTYNNPSNSNSSSTYSSSSTSSSSNSYSNDRKEFLICATISTLRIYHVINNDDGHKKLSLLVQFKLFGKLFYYKYYYYHCY